jgi:hypothetical protein
MAEATTTPLAFTFDSEKKLLVLPITECTDSRVASSRTTFSGVRLFSVDPRFGIHERGAVGEDIPKNEPCVHHTWNHGISRWHRSVVVGDVVILIGDHEVQAIDLRMPYRAASTVDLGE